MKNTLFLLAVSVLLFASCSSSSNGPEEVTKKFVKLLEKGDYDAAKKIATESTDESLDFIKSMAPINDLAGTKEESTFESIECEIDGEFATCMYCCNSDGTSDEYDLFKEKGKWEVDMSKEDLQSLGGEEREPSGLLGGLMDDDDDEEDEDFIMPTGRIASPEFVATEFLKALNADDLDKAKEFGTESTAEMLDFSESMGASEAGELKEITCTNEERKATCNYCCDEEGKDDVLDLVMTSEGWKVDMKKEDGGLDTDDDTPVDLTGRGIIGATASEISQEFLRSLKNKDYAKAKLLGTGKTEDMLESLELLSDGEDHVSKIEDLKCTETEDSAVCTYCCDGEGKIDEVRLSKIDGEWLVDMDKEMPSE